MKCDRSERAGLLAALILTMQVILFFIFYQQMSTSLTLFARRNVDPSFKLCNMTSFSWSAAQFQALNPLWITLLSAFLAIAYTQLARSGHDIPIAAKYALGSFVFAFSGRYAVDGRVSSWVHGSGYGQYSLGRTAGLWTRPRDDRPLRARAHERLHDGSVLRRDGGVLQYLGSVVANFARMPSNNLGSLQSLPLYMKLFFGLAWVGRGRGGCRRHFAAAVESLVARTSALCGGGASRDPSVPFAEACTRAINSRHSHSIAIFFDSV